ncbi:hypothetical protein VNI00_010326 [Paramarasmius palmivorus]|uniref:Uncharacterized protein n=1 Tax=Paramarasmius palmivorus TaxID=297713 RepID=A0AAW0CH21_9AGAR
MDIPPSNSQKSPEPLRSPSPVVKDVAAEDGRPSVSPLIKHSHMAGFCGKWGRLIGQFLEVRDDLKYITMLTSDGGEVKLLFEGDWDLWGQPSRYNEVLGEIKDASTMKLHSFIRLGEELDLNTVNATIDVIHDARFREVFFPQA